MITQLTWSTADNLLFWYFIPLQPSLCHSVPTYNHTNQVAGESSQMLSRCLYYFTGRSTGRKKSEFWSKNLNYMKHKYFGSLSCLRIYNSIKQISSAGSVQFSCYSGPRCRKNALKCMLTGKNIIMEAVQNLNVFAQCINFIFKCTLQHFCYRLEFDAKSFGGNVKKPLHPGELWIGVFMCNIQLIISLNKLRKLHLSLSETETKRASGNEIHRGGSSLWRDNR